LADPLARIFDDEEHSEEEPREIIIIRHSAKRRLYSGHLLVFSNRRSDVCLFPSTKAAASRAGMVVVAAIIILFLWYNSRSTVLSSSKEGVMRKPWTRRKFLGASLSGPLVLSGARAIGQNSAAFSGGLSPAMLGDLRAAVDEIIPASDGMLAANEVNSAEYLTTVASRNREFRTQLQDSLKGLRQIARQRFGKGFAQLTPAQRVETLRAFESKNAASFSNLRDDVYEAYYTNQRVWKQIGYDFYPTNQAGPQMKPFDDSALAAVGKKPRHYREVK